MTTTTIELALGQIVVGDDRRPVVDTQVTRLADSIRESGLQYPISVHRRPVDGKFQLVAGRHRLEAHRKLGLKTITATVMTVDVIKRRLWEIGENLARCELSVLQKSEHIAEWTRLIEAKAKAAQVAHPVAGGQQPKEQGVSKAAKALGIDRRHVQRAVKIDEQTTPEAKAAALEAGLDDNKSALVEIASTPAEKQIDKVAALARRQQWKASSTDIAFEKFNELVLELVRRTKGKQPEDFAKTSIAPAELRELADFLNNVAAAIGGGE